MLAIRAARVFVGERMLPDGAQVVVAEGRIASVGSRTAPVPNACPVREFNADLLATTTALGLAVLILTPTLPGARHARAHLGTGVRSGGWGGA